MGWLDRSLCLPQGKGFLIGALAALLPVGCSSSGAMSGNHGTPTGPNAALLTSGDLPTAWSAVSDAPPPGVSFNNGGPLGRYQVRACVDTPRQPGLVVQVSQDFGLSNSRAWDVVISQVDLDTVFAQLSTMTIPPPGGIASSPGDCFLSVAATELGQVLGLVSFGMMEASPIDLGSYGQRWSSQQVKVPYTYQGQTGEAFLDVMVVKFSSEVVSFGFFSLGQPPAAEVAQHVLASVSRRLP